MTPRARRFVVGGSIVAAAACATTLVLAALRSNLVFFHTPSQLAGAAPPARTLRVGGLVVPGSVRRDGTTLHFRLADEHGGSIAVRHDGLVPDLFREGKGAVVQGRLDGGVFVAREVLAKHDENYYPPPARVAREGTAR